MNYNFKYLYNLLPADSELFNNEENVPTKQSLCRKNLRQTPRTQKKVGKEYGYTQLFGQELNLCSDYSSIFPGNGTILRAGIWAQLC